MVFTNVIFAFLIAILITSLFVWFNFCKERRMWEKRVWPFFIISFLVIWAISIWLIPSGWVAPQYAWIPMVTAIIILATVVISIFVRKGLKKFEEKDKTHSSIIN